MILSNDAASRRSVQRAFRRTQGLVIDGVVPSDSLEPSPAGLVIHRSWVDGTPFLDVIRHHRGAEQVAKAVALAAQLFHTLAGLHREGLVHGHLSPDNIWIQPNGALQLTDIGSSAALLRTALAAPPGTLPPTAPALPAPYAC